MHLAMALTLALSLLVAGVVVRAQPFDYPTAKPSTTWANTDASLTHHATYADGSVARAALLRLNPAGYGPSYSFGFFCTNHQAPPCAEFLLGVAVVYCNSGGLMTSVVAGIPQVVWSANRGQAVGEGASAELTAAGDLVLRSATGAVVWSAGTAGRSVAGMAVTRDGNLVLLDARNATVWQSFDHPTDALLVGQSLRPGARLVANSSAADWAPSRLYLAVADDSLSAYVDAKPPQRYYHLGFSKVTGAYATYANGSLAVFDPATAPAASTPYGAVHAAGARRAPPGVRVESRGVGAGVRRPAPLPGRLRVPDGVRRVRRVHGHAVQLPRRGQLPGRGLPEAQPRLRPDGAGAGAGKAGVAARAGLLQRPGHQPEGAGEGERRRVQEGVPGRVPVRGGAVRVRGRRRRRLLLPAVGGAVDGDVAAGGGALQLHHASQGAGHASSVSRILV